MFSAVIGNGSGTPAAIATAQTQVGVQYGLTLDSTGYWYVDTNKTSGNVVLSITQLDPEFAVGTVGETAADMFDPIFMAAAAELESAAAAGDLTLMIGHVNVAGSMLSNGQPSIGHEIELHPRMAPSS